MAKPYYKFSFSLESLFGSVADTWHLPSVTSSPLTLHLPRRQISPSNTVMPGAVGEVWPLISHVIHHPDIYSDDCWLLAASLLKSYHHHSSFLESPFRAGILSATAAPLSDTQEILYSSSWGENWAYREQGTAVVLACCNTFTKAISVHGSNTHITVAENLRLAVSGLLAWEQGPFCSQSSPYPHGGVSLSPSPRLTPEGRAQNRAFARVHPR
jgi:hypothetical protein